MSTSGGARIEGFAKKGGNVCLKMCARVVHSENVYKGQKKDIHKAFPILVWITSAIFVHLGRLRS